MSDLALKTSKKLQANYKKMSGKRQENYKKKSAEMALQSVLCHETKEKWHECISEKGAKTKQTVLSEKDK